MLSSKNRQLLDEFLLGAPVLVFPVWLSVLCGPTVPKKVSKAIDSLCYRHQIAKLITERKLFVIPSRAVW